MRRSKMWRPVIGLVAGIIVVASATVGASPAYATVGPARYDATSPLDEADAKDAVVDCPDGKVVHGAGGRINNGDGSVIMTRVVPAADLSSVTVSGLALADHVGAWSVTAFATCAGPESFRPYRISNVGPLWSATAACDEGDILYGTGYNIGQATGEAYLDALVPGPDLTQVWVHARGTTIQPLSLRVYGVCAAPNDDQVRCQGTSAFDSTSPKSATTNCPPMLGEGWLFGVGALVEGPGAVAIDALVPGPDLRAAAARATRVPSPPAARTAPRLEAAAGVDDYPDDYSVTTYAVLIGSWY